MALRADDVDLGRDRDLVQRFQNGDAEAFDDLYRRYFDRLHRFCRRHTADSHEAEEVAQEAFVRALRSMHRLDGERRFYPWVTVIAKRISIDRHRKLGRLELTDEPELGAVDGDFDHVFAAVDATNVRAALQRVGPRHREVLLLREAEGLSYADIAARLDVPMTTVEALLHRARKALRREYEAVTGESRGLFGFPLLGWLAVRAGRLRSRLGDRWAELGALAAPVAAGAVTAAVLLSPTMTTEPAESAAATAPRVISPVVVDTDAGTPAPVAGLTGLGGLDTVSPTSAPVSPSVDAGPVDVFLGPEATDAAREEAEQMPIGGDVGPATAGADVPVAVTDLVDFIVDSASFLSGASTSSESTQPHPFGGSR